MGYGKVILFGEHAVVYGRPAIAAGLSKGATAKAERSDSAALIFPGWGKTIAPTSDEPVGDAYRAVLGALECEEPLRITVELEIPAGAGLGASAAIGVALVRAICEARGKVLSEAEAADHAFQWERVFHGNPSGIDNTIAAFGGIGWFQKEKPFLQLAAAKPLTLVVAHSGESSSTKTMVDGVQRQREERPERVNEVFDGIEALALNGKRAIEDGNLRHLGQLLDLNHALLSSLLLSTERIEEICAAARSAGAYGAKVTGAGGGGCVVCLADEERRESVLKALRSLDCEPFSATVG